MTQFRPSGFNVLPTIVKNLIIVNAIVYFAQFVSGNFGIDLVNLLGLHYWKSEYFGVWQFVTHMFLHGSMGHIFMNMFALWMFGSVLENVWGPKKFLTFYILCGLGAAVLHMAVVGYQFNSIESAFSAYQNNPTAAQLEHFGKVLSKMSGASLNISPGAYVNSTEMIKSLHSELYGYTLGNGQHMQGLFDSATIGASGAVFGVLFAFGFLFPNTLLYIYFLVPIKAKYVVAAYAIIELFAGIQNSAGDNVAHFAHLGGMLVAFIILKIWKNDRRNFY